MGAALECSAAHGFRTSDAALDWLSDRTPRHFHDRHLGSIQSASRMERSAFRAAIAMNVLVDG
jgi:hypothetical protein